MLREDWNNVFFNEWKPVFFFFTNNHFFIMRIFGTYLFLVKSIDKYSMNR